MSTPLNILRLAIAESARRLNQTGLTEKAIITIAIRRGILADVNLKTLEQLNQVEIDRVTYWVDHMMRIELAAADTAYLFEQLADLRFRSRVAFDGGRFEDVLANLHLEARIIALLTDTTKKLAADAGSKGATR